MGTKKIAPSAAQRKDLAKLITAAEERFAKYREAIVDANAEIDTAYGDLEGAIQEFNAVVSAQNNAIEAAHQEWSNALSESADHAGEIASSLREELDGRSESWRDSESGAAAEEIVQAWESAADIEGEDAEQIDEATAPDQPEFAELEDDGADPFRKLLEE